MTYRKIKSKGFENYYTEMAVAADMVTFAEKLKGFGLLGILIFMVVDFIAELKKSDARMDLEIAIWEANREKQYADTWRRRYLESAPYHPEVLDNMREEKGKSMMQLQRMISKMYDRNEVNYIKEFHGSRLKLCQETKKEYHEK